MQMHVFTKREEVDTAEAIIEKKETRLAQIRYSSVLSTITSSYTTRQYTQAFTYVVIAVLPTGNFCKKGSK